MKQYNALYSIQSLLPTLSKDRSIAPSTASAP